MELVDWRKPIRGVVWVWVFAGACPGVCGSPPWYGGGSCCQARSKRPVDCKGLGRAGLRRLSRRGSWVQIPPPAPYGSRLVKCEGVFVFRYPRGGREKDSRKK